MKKIASIAGAVALVLVLGACDPCAPTGEPVTPRRPTCAYYDPTLGTSYCPTTTTLTTTTEEAR